ncbi:hypothetical protein LZ32DRAFT_695380 [Colletotrichum eremochloae]|nr:hypothetical protein LY78DRAFT_695755 [Colletotrichum sublineola]KAK2007444.1 hypothetical protein LZ32DRAFT_695380 [Colletotrichum eremochloae]
MAAVLVAFAAAAPTPEPAELVARQCTCKKYGDEWLCIGPKCGLAISYNKEHLGAGFLTRDLEVLEPSQRDTYH